MIKHHNGPLEFELHEDWVAEPDQEWGHIYYRSGDNDSALRVCIINAIKPGASASEFYKTISDRHNKYPNSQLTYLNEKPILCYEKISAEGTSEIKLYFWEIGNFMPPDCGQTATFSYTILKLREKDPQNRTDIETLWKAVKSLKFSGARHL